MHVKHIARFFALLLLLVAIPFGVAAQGTPEASPTSRSLSFELTGAIAAPGTVTLDDLKSLPTQTTEVTFLSGQGEQVHTYTGVLLLDLIEAKGLVVDEAAKNDKLGKYIVATGSDGYEAVVAYGEIDPDFGNQPILVAYEEDGVALTAARLVVPGDGHGGRYVSDIVSIEVRGVDSEPRS